MFKFIPVNKNSPEQQYYIHLEHPYTVKEFIAEVVSRQHEYGIIKIREESNNVMCYKSSYDSHGIGIPEKYSNRRIKNITAEDKGKHLRVDYSITLESMESEDYICGYIYERFLKDFHIDKNNVKDYRHCNGIYFDYEIPNAIIVWMKDGSKIIYIYKEEMEEVKTN